MARSTGGESWKAQKSKCACSKFMVVAHGETIKAQRVVGVGGGVWRGKTLRIYREAMRHDERWGVET